MIPAQTQHPTDLASRCGNEFSGNLSIKINDQTAKNIQPRNTPDDSDYPAYQLVNTLGSDNVPLPSIFDYVSLGLTQSLNFWLDEQGETQLTVRVDPESQQIEQLELTQVQQDGQTLKQQIFYCLADSTDETRCQNVSLSINAQTGRVAINFNSAQLLELGLFETGRSIATLNGTLVGELSLVFLNHSLQRCRLRMPKNRLSGHSG